MIHEYKKQFFNCLILTSLLYTIPQSSFADEQDNISIINEAVLNHKKKISNKKSKTQKKFPVKINTKAEKKQAQEKKVTYPAKIDYEQRDRIQSEKLKIREINVEGNVSITKDAVLHKLPLKVGDIFNINYTATMIKNLYKTGFFNQVKIFAEPINNKKIDLYIALEEKPRFVEMEFEGNDAISEKDIKKAINYDSIVTLSKEEIVPIISKIKKLYRKKSFHDPKIVGEIFSVDGNKVGAKFKINEGKKAMLSCIKFKGNKHISSKKLKKIIYSKEDWILGALSGEGAFDPERVEADKYMIEDAYKSNGFLHAKVTDTKITRDPITNHFFMTFVIHEGNRYLIKEVKVPGNDTIPEKILKYYVTFAPGYYYSQKQLRDSIENLKLAWGEKGYIFADIDPSVDIDEKDKTVSITFHSDIKEPVTLNRLIFKGNNKTHDGVIRRSTVLDEGELITKSKEDASKNALKNLGYFDEKDGVTIKTTKINEKEADLEVILKEIKTGYFNFNLGYGGSKKDASSPQDGVSFSINTGDRNLDGTGISTGLSVEIAKKQKGFSLNAANPYLMDKPLFGTFGLGVKTSEYEDVKNTQDAPEELSTGFNIGLGWYSKKLHNTLVNGSISYERISYQKELKVLSSIETALQPLTQMVIDRTFQPGAQLSFGLTLSQDFRNGRVFTTDGYQWSFLNQMTFPGETYWSNKKLSSRFQYYKMELDGSWYSPLIGNHDLVLGLHGNFSYIHKFENRQVPWKNLYHIGGPTTVRGYTYGQVGPTWHDDSQGATKALVFNAELSIPVTSNLDKRIVFFYDGGAGWDTPYYSELCKISQQYGDALQNNKFFYRHSVGVGFRMKTPSPLQIDFGIKLNPSKLFKNKHTELHLSMEHTF